MNVKKEKNQKPQITVAIVYATTLAICLGIFGLIGYFAVKDFVPGAEAESSDAGETVGVTYSKSDSLTTLYTVTDGQNTLHSIVLAKFMPSSQKIIIIPLTPYTDCNGQTLAMSYATQGIAALTDSVSTLLNVPIDKYMTLSTSTFSDVADIMGTSIVTLIDSFALYDPAQDDYVNYSKGDRLAVDGNIAVELITYADYSNGYATNMKMSGEIAATLINTFFSHTESAKNNIDAIFRKMYSDANTNMSEDEYNQMKNAIIHVIENSSSPSYSLTPTGSWSDDGTLFTVDPTFISQLDGYLEED